MKEHMTHRERVLTALKGLQPDRIPWIEGIVGNRIASAAIGEPVNVDWSVAPEGFSKTPGDILAKEQIKVNKILGKANIQFSAFAPVFAYKMEPSNDGSPVLVGDGMIKTRDDFERIFKLPKTNDDFFIQNAKDFIKMKGDYCACACVRLGIGALLLSMGLEAFSYAMADDPDLIKDIHDQYADWTGEVVPILEEIGFDVIWAFDDVAFNSGPVFSPAFYEEHILPKEKQIVSKFTKPLITHSDGNMTELLETWLKLGQQGIHPIQPDVMDIKAVKDKYKICIVGNVFMDDLVNKEPEEIRKQVIWLKENIGRGGGYILSSSNSLTDNMKPENILAIREALYDN